MAQEAPNSHRNTMHWVTQNQGQAGAENKAGGAAAATRRESRLFWEAGLYGIVSPPPFRSPSSVPTVLIPGTLFKAPGPPAVASRTLFFGRPSKLPFWLFWTLAF